MFQHLYEPHPALRGFVSNIMMHEVVLDPAHAPHSFSVPPLPEQFLMFYVRDSIEAEEATAQKKETLSSSIVVGPNINRHIMTPGRHHLMIKVGFQPGGLYRFSGIPMSELLCQDAFDAAGLFGNKMNEITDQLRHAISFTEMKTIVERFLLTRLGNLKQPLPIDEVLPLLVKGQGLVKIDRLASLACLSIRQFERVFQQRIGLPPKHFTRLVRFSKAWMMKEQHPGIPWIKIAHECGYFDQMHLIRDFREFAAVNPSIIEPELLASPVKAFDHQFQ